jgi:hypothetical protein
MENEELYGASMPLLDKLKLFAEWAPLIGRLQLVMDAKTPHDRAVAICEALKWAAGKTSTHLDDEALDHVEQVLKTPEGQAAFDWVVKIVGGVA